MTITLTWGKVVIGLGALWILCFILWVLAFAGVIKGGWGP